MNILSELQFRFRPVLAALADDPNDLLDMIRPSQDPKFGDYQANCAMPLGKRLSQPPRDVAASIVEQIDVADLCEPPEIAGPGFINLRLKDDWLVEQIQETLRDDRLGVAPIAEPKTFVIDYSSPNVAKPMHVGHIRSTVIGDAICRTLRFLGHTVISDNHLGDWGTQFGMIIYGYKHFADPAAYEKAPVAELGRLYKLVNQLVEYHNGKQQLPKLETSIEQQTAELHTLEETPPTGDKAADKKTRKTLSRLKDKLGETKSGLQSLQMKLDAVESNAKLAERAREHTGIASAVLEETAKLHEGDAENRELWDKFLPFCRDEIQRVYGRLDIQFDYEHGESFYQDQLGAVVDAFEQQGLARESDGATCVFLDGFETPMIIRKKDGAFLYATTDLATIQYRMKEWQPSSMLYVVDHRQGEHFDKLFAAARKWKYTDVDLRHISFGTVLGEDKRPYKTRSGDTVGLEGLLDEAVRRAREVVDGNDDATPDGSELSDDARQQISETVGIGAIKYADLAQNRTSDYVFSYDKMLALNGNTATYMQYSYARVHGIFSRGGVDIDALRGSGASIVVSEPAERALVLKLLGFGEALDEVVVDYRPNQLTVYLFDLAKTFSAFFENCPVLKAETDQLRSSRLLLCDLTSRAIKQGLALLGIKVVDKM